jgi:CheY-like chemotaxis protein
LVAEDDKAVLGIIEKSLKSIGYRLLIADNGYEAQRICESEQRPIQLLLTDLVMPKIGGYQVAEVFKRIFPKAAVVFMSGYSKKILSAEENLYGGFFLSKPFEIAQLLQTVREALNSTRTIKA